MANNKIIYGDQVLIDLTQDTVTADKLAQGITAHDRSGEIITGTNTYDADTSDATAIASEILTGKTAYANGQKVEGTMPNRGAEKLTIAKKDEFVPIKSGYHDGSGSVTIDFTEQNKIIPGNIKSGITILGITGDYGGEEIKVQTKEATPYTTEQTILPDEEYDYLSQVKVKAIHYEETPNAQGGMTVTIGEIAPV